MRAIVYHPGGDSVLELIDRPIPPVGAGEVRVRVIVAGVNPTDLDARRRDRDVVATTYVPGQDGAGIVDAVGEHVDGIEVGDRVWLWDVAWQRTEGTAQEYVVVPAIQAVRLPAEVSFDVGASLGIPALTAHRALTSLAEGPLELSAGALSGRCVLVAGGAGAVGNAAIQLARWAGAEVIATVSDQTKGRLARAAGAHHVLNYREVNVPDEVSGIAEHGVDLIVEVNAQANIAADMAMIGQHGGISIYTPGDGTTSIPSIPAMTKNIQVSFILTYTTTLAQKHRAVQSVSTAVAEGALTVGDAAGLPITRYTLAETELAHSAVEHHAVGKVLVDVAKDLTP